MRLPGAFALLILAYFHVTSAKRKCEKESAISAYPTCFYEDIVPQFVNNRPTIGILAMEVHGQKILVEVPWAYEKDYFGASFVKLVESAGARAVPILEDMTHDDLDVLLHKINGVILPGGDADIGDSGYERISKQIIKFSKQQAKKNITFPVLGVCRGAQMMMIAEAGKDFLEDTDSLNFSIPLEFTKDAKKSRLFGHASKGLKKALSTEAITFNAHAMSIPAANFYNNTDLQKIFRALSINYDRNGTKFISTFEGVNAPLYGFQWHPEKVLFVFNPTLAVDHTITSVIASQYVANFFVSEARKNPQRFRDRFDEEDHLLMAQGKGPQYVGNLTETPYEQVYMFEFEQPFQNKKLDGRKEEEH